MPRLQKKSHTAEVETEEKKDELKEEKKEQEVPKKAKKSKIKEQNEKIRAEKDKSLKNGLLNGVFKVFRASSGMDGVDILDKDGKEVKESAELQPEPIEVEKVIKTTYDLDMSDTDECEEAVKIFPYNIVKTNSRFRKNPKNYKSFIAKYPYILFIAPKEIRDNEELAEIAINQDPYTAGAITRDNPGIEKFMKKSLDAKSWGGGFYSNEEDTKIIKSIIKNLLQETREDLGLKKESTVEANVEEDGNKQNSNNKQIENSQGRKPGAQEQRGSNSGEIQRPKNMPNHEADSRTEQRKELERQFRAEQRKELERQLKEQKTKQDSDEHQLGSSEEEKLNGWIDALKQNMEKMESREVVNGDLGKENQNVQSSNSEAYQNINYNNDEAWANNPMNPNRRRTQRTEMKNKEEEEKLRRQRIQDKVDNARDVDLNENDENISKILRDWIIDKSL